MCLREDESKMNDQAEKGWGMYRALSGSAWL